MLSLLILDRRSLRYNLSAMNKENANVFNKWRQGLTRTRTSTFGRISQLLGFAEIDDETWDDLEAMFVQSDMGIETTEDVIKSLRKRVEEEGLVTANQLRDALYKELYARMDAPPEIIFSESPSVILIVGVNGSGKTTNMAKLGQRYQEEGKRVIFGAADTFRAAAIEQLQIWGKRLNIPVIAGQQDGDPGAVAYDTVQAGLARNADIILIDTAGRLHTRFNLMEELKKVYRVTGKALPGSPHAVWLVMDAFGWRMGDQDVQVAPIARSVEQQAGHQSPHLPGHLPFRVLKMWVLVVAHRAFESGK